MKDTSRGNQLITKTVDEILAKAEQYRRHDSHNGAK